MNSTTLEIEFDTLADLLSHFGQELAHRVRLRPMPATAEDVVEIHDREDRLYELIDGVLVEKALGAKESCYAGVLIHLLWNYLDIHPIGIVLSPDGMIRVGGGRIRIPDVSFVSWGRLPGGMLPQGPFVEVAPDLAVEVLSPSNTPAEMNDKLRDYFEAGTTLVWYMDPVDRSVRVYTSIDQMTLDRGGGYPRRRTCLARLSPDRARMVRRGSCRSAGNVKARRSSGKGVFSAPDPPL